MSHKAIVWSKSQCPDCERAKLMLRNKQIEFEERKIGLLWSKDDLLAVVPHARTVPQIFLNEQFIGGVNELKEYFTQESLHVNQ